MHFIHTAGRKVAHRLPSRWSPSQPCFLRCTRWPVLRFNASLIRAQHDTTRPQAPRAITRPQADGQQPLPIEEKPHPELQYAKLNTDDSPGGPAQAVSGQGSQNPIADTRDASQRPPPFICEECGSTFRNKQGLQDHQLDYKSQESLGGEAGGCKHRTSVAGMNVGNSLARTPGIVLFHCLPAMEYAVFTHLLG